MLDSNRQIKKLHLSKTVSFAITHIPQADRATLEKLLEMVNADGTHGVIDQTHLVRKMRLLLKYVPGACATTLLILIDLLGLQPIELAAFGTPPPASRLSPQRRPEPTLETLFTALQQGA